MKHSKSARASLVVAALVGVVALVTPLARATTSERPSFDTTTNHDNPYGEPSIAVNPRDTSNIVESNGSAITTSFDRGKTWRKTTSLFGDTVAVADRDGRFFVGGIDVPNLTTVSIQRSTDGGRTWTAPVAVLSTLNGSQRGMGFDRPQLAVDQSSGVLYISGALHDEASGGGGDGGVEKDTLNAAGCQTSVFTSPAFDCGRRYVSSSHDHGVTWSSLYPIDSPDHPNDTTGGFSGILGASKGMLGTAYYTSRAAGHRDCPCLVFETSTDDGVHWQRHVVPGAKPAVEHFDPDHPDVGRVTVSDSQTVLFGPYVAADPTTRGMFAVAMNNKAVNGWFVYLTKDAGRTWSTPVLVGTTPKDGYTSLRPSLGYGPTGVLGFAWRETRPDTGFFVWAAVARPGTLRFSRPLPVSSGWSPPPGNQNGNDDCSYLVMDATYLHVAWGDARADKQIEPWYGRYRYTDDVR